MCNPTARDLIQRLADELEGEIKHKVGWGEPDYADKLINEARAYLAQPSTGGPKPDHVRDAAEPMPSMTNCFFVGPPPAPHKSVSEWYEQEGSKGILHGLYISPLPSRGGPKPDHVRDATEMVPAGSLADQVVPENYDPPFTAHYPEAQTFVDGKECRNADVRYQILAIAAELEDQQ